VVLVLVVVFHLSLKRHLVDGWNGGGGTSRRVGAKCGKAEICQMWEGGNVPFWEWRKRDFPCCVILVVPRASRAAGREGWMCI
jgi:hypothetical protein